MPGEMIYGGGGNFGIIPLPINLILALYTYMYLYNLTLVTTCKQE